MIKVGLIGLNYYSHSVQIYQSILKQAHLFEVAGYCLPEGEAEKYPEKTACLAGLRELSLTQMLADPSIDAVIVETDEIYLTKYALAAAKAGKHVHMEKPGGNDSAAFEALIRTAEEHGTVLHLGYMYRYNPAVQALLRRIKGGELGEIISVEAQMSCIQKPAVRQWLGQLPGGQMFFLGCHLIDLILQIQGLPRKVLPLSTDAEYGFAALQYEKGISFAKTHAAEYGGFARRGLTVTGTKATVELRPLEVGKESDMHTCRTEYTSEKWGDGGTVSQSAPFDRYDSMMAAFADYAAGKKQNPYTYDYELSLYKTFLAACGLH